MFATKRHPKTLADAETWYVNHGTLNVVQKPFMQLLTINSFIKSGENVNQVPLVFDIMANKKTKDCKEVCIF